jgi:thioredoxin reductase (NADPH)
VSDDRTNGPAVPGVAAPAGPVSAVLGTHAADRAALARRHAARGHVAAVVLCAEWCTTCRDFLPAFAELAARRPEASWVWIDIEDDAALVGDVDVETFPTVALYVDATLRHFGPMLPQAALVERLVDNAGRGRADDAPEDIAGLMRALLAG